MKLTRPLHLFYGELVHKEATKEATNEPVLPDLKISRVVVKDTDELAAAIKKVKAHDEACLPNAKERFPIEQQLLHYLAKQAGCNPSTTELFELLLATLEE